MLEITFMIFGLGFFLYVMNLCTHENRRSQARQDQRDDLAYNRGLNERREFGKKP